MNEGQLWTVEQVAEALLTDERVVDTMATLLVFRDPITAADIDRIVPNPFREDQP